MNSKFGRVGWISGYKGGLDRLDEDVVEKYDPSGATSDRTSHRFPADISLKSEGDEPSVTAKRYYTYDVIHAYART